MSISQLQYKILSLENDNMLLEKKLKFQSIMENMRNSTNIRDPADEVETLRREAERHQKENQALKSRIEKMGDSEGMAKELKSARKQLKKERKMHEADLNVLSSLQSVGSGGVTRRSTRSCKRSIST